VTLRFKELILTTYFYETEQEALDLVKTAEKDNDVLLFGGPVPYNLVLSQHRISVPTDYISFDGAALYMGLLKMISMSKETKNKVSIDTISRSIIDQTLHDIGLEKEHFFIHENTNVSNDKLTLFHESLFNEKKTTFAMTCLRSTYRLLQQKNIPSVLILPPETSLRDSIQKSLLNFQSEFFRKSQIVVGLLTINPLEKLNLSYLNQKKQLEIHHSLLGYAQDFHAALFHLNNLHFVFYTTEGMLSKNDPSLFYSLNNVVKKLMNSSIHIGLGIGPTALSAQNKANIALKYCNHKPQKDHCYMIRNGEEVIDLLKINNQKTDLFKTENKAIVKLSEENKVSPILLSKLLKVMDKLDCNTFTAHELSIELSQTERNIRRTLNIFEKKGLAIKIGYEHYNGQGRPKTLYQIKLKEVIQNL
jgi:hypothetical protein